jgi:predicted metal-dependent hydrolase
VRSTKRRKTVALRPIEGGVRISIPARSTKAEEERYVQTLLRRYERRQATTEIDLTARARQLASKYKFKTPTDIRWADNQNSRWGSCTPSTGTIRISTNVIKFPSWVLEYVIVHELAHLSIHGHGPDFWDLVNRYPKAERARGFLIAKGAEDENDEAEPGEPSADVAASDDDI